MSEELRRGIPKAISIGRVEYTKEEEEEIDRRFEQILKKMGVLKENESIKDCEYPDFSQK